MDDYNKTVIYRFTQVLNDHDISYLQSRLTSAEGIDSCDISNCEMCEKRIEKAASQIEGVSSADWNKETKMINVVLDDSNTDVHKVHMAIAKAGHDTEMHRATDEAYDALPGCCRYQRINKKEEKMQMKMHPVHQH